MPADNTVYYFIWGNDVHVHSYYSLVFTKVKINTHMEAHVTVEYNYTRGSAHNRDRELHTWKRT